MADDIRLVLSVDDRDLIRTRKEQQRFQFQIAQIEKEYRKGTITAFRYNTELVKQSKQLSRLGGSYRQAASEVRQYAASLRNATDDQVNLALAMTKSGKGMRRMEILAQQAGYQIGDLAVQIQSGTNAAVALGQQGSQLLGFFGPKGAIAGAALAIGTGLIAPFLKAKDAAKEAREEAEALAKFLEGIQQDIDILRTGARNVQELKAIQKLEQAQKAYNEAKQKTASLDQAAVAPRQFAAKPQAATAEKEALVDLEKAKEELKEIRDLLNEREEITSRVERIEEATARSISVGKKAYQEMVSSQQEIVDAANKIKSSVEDRIFKLNQENALLAVASKYGKDSAEYKLIEESQSKEALKRELEKQGIIGNNLKTIMALVDEQQRLNDKLDDEEEKRKRIAKLAAKIAFSDLGMTEGMAALAYQQYGQSREKGANITPPKGPKGTKGKTPAESMASIIKGMEEQANLQRQIVGLSDQEADYLQILYNLKEQNKTASGKMTEAQLKQAAERIAAINAETAAMEAQMQKIQDVADSFETHFGDALMGIVTDFDFLNDSIEDFGYNAEQVFKNMAREIIKELYRIFVVKKITGFISAAVGDVGSLYQGSTGFMQFSGGGYTGSGPRSGGLDGKGGFLAMLHPKETVIDHTKGQSAEGVTVVQNINISTGVQQTVRNEIRTLMPQIANSAKAAVSDAKRRGGSYGRALS
jgi:hypothetical protein